MTPNWAPSVWLLPGLALNWRQGLAENPSSGESICRGLVCAEGMESRLPVEVASYMEAELEDELLSRK